jgi:hypothetical protein
MFASLSNILSKKLLFSMPDQDIVASLLFCHMDHFINALHIMSENSNISIVCISIIFKIAVNPVHVHKTHTHQSYQKSKLKLAASSLSPESFGTAYCACLLMVSSHK